MASAGRSWIELPTHHHWLTEESDRLLRFHEAHALGEDVGFAPLGVAGDPTDGPRDLYATARMVHCFSIAHLLGRPGAAAIAQHGISTIEQHFEDRLHGGWFAQVDARGRPLDATKDAYGHAFVILAASSAMQAGLPTGRPLLNRALSVLEERFWREDEGAVINALSCEWEPVEPDYRGQNANMHLTEALMATFEATGDRRLQRQAERIAGVVIDNHARACQWRVPEHFDGSWQVLPEYNADQPQDPFRPPGTLVGHSMEWVRLLLQLDALEGADVPWAPAAARELFDAAIRDGWDGERSGLVYSVDLAGAPINTHRMHWGVAEAIGAAAWLKRAVGGDDVEAWYRTFWDYAARFLIDPHGGSWWHEVDGDGDPAFTTWSGKPDLYHAYQATLYARGGARFGLAEAAKRGIVV